jgi:four helix bundle protein
MVKCAEELHVFQRALDLARDVSAILKRRGFRETPRLKDQIGSSSTAVAALIAEGFSLSTDRHFAQLLYRSRSESAETRAHLRIANARGHVTQSELDDLLARYNEVEKMLTGLIRYLQQQDRTDRG